MTFQHFIEINRVKARCLLTGKISNNIYDVQSLPFPLQRNMTVLVLQILYSVTV